MQYKLYKLKSFSLLVLLIVYFIQQIVQIDKHITNILIVDTYPNMIVLSFLTIHVSTSPIKENNIIKRIENITSIISPPNCFNCYFIKNANL